MTECLFLSAVVHCIGFNTKIDKVNDEKLDCLCIVFAIIDTYREIYIVFAIIDTYREIYPDVLAYPGFTFPADNPLIPVNKLTWAPKADERDRIDYIFYYPAEGLSVKDAVIFGPEGSICKSQRIKETSKDRFITPLAVWPTDHKGLLVTFGLTANSGR